MEKYRLVQEVKAEPAASTGREVPFHPAHAAAGVDSALMAPPTWPPSTQAPPPQQQQHHHHIPEVRITQQGKPRNYISYAMTLFADGSSTLVLKAMGRAINKAVTIAEILKRKLPLHQLNMLSSVEMIDVYEPVEEGLDTVTSRRYVSCMMITLSLTADALDTEHCGYQPPLPEAEIFPGDYAYPVSPTALLPAGPGYE